MDEPFKILSYGYEESWFLQPSPMNPNPSERPTMKELIAKTEKCYASALKKADEKWWQCRHSTILLYNYIVNLEELIIYIYWNHT